MGLQRSPKRCIERLMFPQTAQSFLKSVQFNLEEVDVLNHLQHFNDNSGVGIRVDQICPDMDETEK